MTRQPFRFDGRTAIIIYPTQRGEQRLTGRAHFIVGRYHDAVIAGWALGPARVQLRGKSAWHEWAPSVDELEEMYAAHPLTRGRLARLRRRRELAR